MQVEELGRIELPDGRAVRALHVVGEDLELRLGVDGRVVGNKQVLIALLGVGLLRDLPYDNAAKTPGYNDFMNTPLTDSEFSRDPNRCMKLLLLFKKNM